MYPYQNMQAQNPLAGLNLYDPMVRQWVLQNYPQYASMLPQQAQFMHPQQQFSQPNPYGYQQVPQQMPQQFPQMPGTAEGQAVLAMFEEFAKTEDGKLLVSYMGKFNSYCQSQVAKAQQNNS